MALNTAAPNLQTPFLDQRTGLVSREWYMFLLTVLQAGNVSITGGSIAGVSIDGATIGASVPAAATVTTLNKLTFTQPSAGATYALANGKTFSVANTLSLTSTDGATLAIGSGGTLGTAAYTAVGAYAAAGGASTQAFVAAAFGCNGKAAQTAYVSGAAAPAGGTGVAAGAWDTAAHRDAAIALINNIQTALIANGILT